MLQILQCQEVCSTLLSRYLIHQLKQSVIGTSPVLEFSCREGIEERKDDDKGGTFFVKNSVSFHFYTSQVPCKFKA